MKLYLIKQFSVTFITQTYLKLSDYCLISLEVSTTLHQTYNLLTCISDLFRKEPPVLYVTSIRALGRIRPTFNNVLISRTKLIHKSYDTGRVFCSFRRKVMIPSGSELYILDLSQNQHGYGSPSRR